MSDVTPEHVEQAASPPPPGSTWAPLDLAAIVAGVLDGRIVGPTPSLMRRTDGVALLYPGEVHSLAGEPEAGKGWTALQATVDELEHGHHVLYLDFEDSPASVVTRLLALGAQPAGIVERFVYVKPEEAVTREALAALLAGRTYSLAVLDGVTEAYALLGLDYGSNQDVPTFLRRLVRPIAATRAAVLLIDHVPKDKTNRGRFAIGAQHKLAGIAVAYGVEVITPPSRTQAGLIKLLVHKDRHGHVRGHAHAGVIALARIEPQDNGNRVTVTLDPPDATDDTGAFRPTLLMERASLTLEAEPGLSKTAVRAAVKGKTNYVDLALELLTAEGYVRVEQDGQARRHHVVTPYREADDPNPDPLTQPCPNPDPVAGETDPDPLTLPLRGGQGTGQGGDHNGHTPTLPLEALTADVHEATP